VYHLYYTYFFTLVRAQRYGASLAAWANATALAPAAPVRSDLAPLAEFVQVVCWTALKIYLRLLEICT